MLAVAAVLLAPAAVITANSKARQAAMYQPLQDTLYFRLADASDIDHVSSIEVREGGLEWVLLVHRVDCT